MRVLLLLVALMFTATSSVFAAGESDFNAYVKSLKNEALEQGFSSTLLDRAFNDITFRPTAVKADKNQPEKKITLDDYIVSRVPDWKAEQAVQKYLSNRALLDKIGEEYGVQPRFIVALWGNESNFGKIQGSYSVLSALASLAYEGRREALFKKNFFAALTILDQGHIPIDSFKGSWAGALGQTQFMPLSFLTYAVDYDGDGKKDIWGTPADVFASIANYLSSEGWDDSGTWGRQVRLTQDVPISGLSKENMRPLSYWQEHGVRRFDGSDLPKVDVKASLIMPDGESGRIYLVYNNFHTLMKWNRSSYFGVSVGYLSERIKRGY